MSKSDLHKKSLELARKFASEDPEELENMIDKYSEIHIFLDEDMIGYVNWFRNIFNPFEIFYDENPNKKWGKWDNNNEMLKYTDKEMLELYLKFVEDQKTWDMDSMK